MRFLVVALLGLLVGCSGSRSSAPLTAHHRKGAVDAWVLNCVDPTETTPALLWNGLIGVRIGRDGVGVHNGLLAIECYETAGEEKIQPLPNPVGLRWSFEGETLDPSKGVAYRQFLDMRTGILSTTWKQGSMRVSVDTAMSPDSTVIAEEWTLEGEGGEVAWHAATGGAYTGKGPMGRRSLAVGDKPLTEEIHIHGASGGSWSENGWRGTASRKVVLDRVLVFQPRGMREAVLTLPSFDAVAGKSRDGWAERWKTDIEIDGPVEDQQSVRSFLFYLRSAIAPSGLETVMLSPLHGKQPEATSLRVPISPFGLSDPTYNGHFFWDEDTWVFPALSLVAPNEARAITAYRLLALGQSEDNYASWFMNGGPNYSKPPKPMLFGGVIIPAVLYPWESSVSGKETAVGESKWEHHVTGDVALAFWQAGALGLVPESSAQRIINEADQFYDHRSELGSGHFLEIKGTMSPDENHIGDNDLYTNLLATWCRGEARMLTIDGMPPKNRLWGGAHAKRGQAAPATFKLPRDDKSFLSYDGDGLRGYKQAAAVLAIYPLQYPPAEKEARVMMERFADKVSKNGPAMSDSVHSIIWSRLGEKEKAYKTWQDSWQPFTAHPLMLFSEKRTKDVCYFTTGAAGSLQSVLYGFLGFRIDYKKQDGAAWSLPLNGGSWLSVKPHLPAAWKSVKFKNFSVLGRRYTLTATQTQVHVSRGE